MVWRRAGWVALFVLCVAGGDVLADKRLAVTRLKQLPLVGKVFEDGALQKVGMAVFAAGFACMSLVGCMGKSQSEQRYDDLARAEKRKLERAERQRIRQYVNGRLLETQRNYTGHIHGGLLPMQRSYTSYVHVDSKYRNTRQRIIYEGDAVYFEQDGGVYYGVVERHVHPQRVIVGQLYGTAIYDDLGRQKRLIDIDLIRGVSFQHHDDLGLMLVMENDDTIFRRDDDDYFARFHARVVDVYDDGYYRLLVEYGTDTRGNRVYLQDSYTLFSHRNLWQEHSVPLTDHADLGVGAIVLGPRRNGNRVSTRHSDAGLRRWFL